ncbi:PaaI family thioesterase [Mycobacterium sp. BMJ-28]
MEDRDITEVVETSRELVGAVRDLMTATAVTDVDTRAMREATSLVRRVTRILGVRSLPMGRRENLDPAAIDRVRDGERWEVFTHNPMGIPLRIVVDGSGAAAEIVPTALFEGPPNVLHGGFAAAMIDALLSTLVQAQGVRAVTARLDVRFRAAAAIGEALNLSGRIESVDGRKILTRSEIRQRDVIIADAHALFITVDGEPD